MNAENKDYASNKQIKVGDWVKSKEVVFQEPPKATRESMELMNRKELAEHERGEIERMKFRADGKVERSVKGLVVQVLGFPGGRMAGGMAVIQTASGKIEHVGLESCEIIDSPESKPEDPNQMGMFND